MSRRGENRRRRAADPARFERERLGPSPKAVAAYRALAGEIHRYPDGSAEELREALARRHGLDPARIVAAPARTS